MNTQSEVLQVPSENGTTFHADPKLAAYKYAAWVRLSGLGPFLMRVEAGVYTVEATGLETARFAKLEDRTNA